jgi:bromodomain-containing factor 1
MAVMTSQHPDGVAFDLDQKITPVPSSDKMALDLEING